MTRTEEELKKLREKMVEKPAEMGIRFSYITCDSCPHRYECPYAYDPYNIDGDCLAEK